MQQPSSHDATNGASEVRLPADPSPAGKDAPDQPSVDEQDKCRHDDLGWPSGPDTASQKVGQPAEDQSARTENDRVGRRQGPRGHSGYDNDDQRGGEPSGQTAQQHQEPENIERQ